MRKLALFAAWAAAAFGQTASVYISAARNIVVCGDQLPLTASPQDRTGAAVNNVTLAWSSTDGSIASVDSKGNVAALKLGFATITAAAGNVRGTFQVQVVPLRIEVTPRSARLKIGDQQQFSASVLDINEQAIDNAPVTWQISGSNGFFTAAATIDNTGLLSTVAANTVTVRAVIAYAGLPNGFSNQFVGLATALIQPPADYRLRRLLTSEETRSSFRLLPRRGGIAVDDSGRVALIGALDGLTAGVLVNDQGKFQLPLSGGTPTFSAGGNLIDFQDPVMNGAGQIVVRADALGNSGSIFLLDKSGLQYIATDGTVVPGYGDLQNTNISRFSLNDSGTVLFRAAFLPDGATTRSTGLFENSGGPMTLDVYSPGAPPPGLADPFTFDQDFGIDNQGSVYFSAFDGKTRAVYQKTADGAFRKALATGDPLGSSTVRSIFRFGLSSSGDLAIGGDTNANSQFLLRYSDGDLSKPPETLLLNSFGQIYNITRAGVLFLADAGRGYGLYLWPPRASAATPILLFGKASPSGSEIIEIQGAAMNSPGVIIAKLRTVASSLEVVKYLSGNLTPLLRAGDTVEVQANLSVRGLVPGAVAGNTHPFLGGYQSSVFEIDNALGLIPRVLTGDQLDLAPFYGSLPVRKSPDGTLYVTNDDGIFRVSTAGVDAIARVPRRDPDGVMQTNISFLNQNLNGAITSGALAANDNGAAVWISETNQSHRRLYLSTGGKVQMLAFLGGNPAYRTASPSGGYFSDFQEIAIDNNARVMARLTVTGGPSGYFLWDGAWKAAALFGQTRIADIVADNGFELKCAGGDFFAIFIQRGTASMLARYSGAGWTPVFAANQNIPTGTYLQSFRTLAVNRSGEVAFSGTADGGVPIVMVVAKDNTGRLVYTGADPAPDGSFLINIPQVEFRDDRRVYFIGLDIWDRINVYVAEPLF